MELRHIRYFVAVAEAGSFRGAADILHIAQPALSRQIAALEAELGVPLFNTGSRRRVLSSAGEAFLDDAREILANVDRAKARAQSVNRGEHARLRIAFTEIASDSAAISSCVARLRTAMPNVEISLLPMPSWHQSDALLRDKIDAGFLYQIPDMDSRIAFHGLADDSVMAVMPRTHPLAHQSKIHRRDLEGKRLIFVSRSVRSDFYQAIEEAFRDATVPPHIEQVGAANTVASLVSVGMGIGLLTATMKSRLPTGVVMRPIVDLPLQYRLGLAWCPGYESPLVLRMVAAAKIGHAL